METVTAVIVADSLAGDTGKAAHLGQTAIHARVSPAQAHLAHSAELLSQARFTAGPQGPKLPADGTEWSCLGGLHSKPDQS